MSDEEPVRLANMLVTIEGMRDVLFAQARLIDDSLHLLAKVQDAEILNIAGDKGVFDVITTMIHMVGISGNSLLTLTDQISLSVRDAFPVARSIAEGVINICYIMAIGPEAAHKAARHAEVRAFRDLKRQWEVAGMRVAVQYSGHLEASELARLELMLPEFTSKRGVEKDWTDHTLKQRLAIIAEKFPSTSMTMLNTSAFNIYRHASEVVHGSYFSALYFWGLTLPGRPRPTSRSDMRLILVDHQFSVLMSAVFAYAGLLECFAKYASVPKLAEDSRRELDRIREFPAIAEALAEQASD